MGNVSFETLLFNSNVASCCCQCLDVSLCWSPSEATLLGISRGYVFSGWFFFFAKPFPRHGPGLVTALVRHGHGWPSASDACQTSVTPYCCSMYLGFCVWTDRVSPVHPRDRVNKAARKICYSSQADSELFSFTNSQNSRSHFGSCPACTLLKPVLP